VKVALSDRAKRDLREIQSWIAYDNPMAALRVATRILQLIELLADFPQLGRKWEDGLTRAIVVPRLPYRIHYQVDDSAGTVNIITVVHTRRRPPTL
jgi:addiction module RelE/StbE family toxin